jgi:UDP-galactose transporter B1
MFCLCASLGQVLIFGLMKDFGSLVWITVSITRKLFTILVSVFMFNHSVNAFQWFGIVCAFVGMGLEEFSLGN